MNFVSVFNSAFDDKDEKLPPPLFKISLTHVLHPQIMPFNDGRPGSRSGQKREEDSVASGGGQGPSFVDERSLSPEPAATIMRDDTSPAGYDAIARAPHLIAS
ncbi:unnamed protein product [Cylicocyclus nassatus]|uniref:Uncharacterized protein n=1 Tax=Cylicocyclus nassatus TaxID=53992 RepID=A0AA36GXD7_CYLNA|nr:unnamed protein product [Cylicocyclus nassatus]